MSRYKRYERYKDSGVEWIGDIPEHWELRRIKFIGTLYSGNGFKEELQGKEEGDYPFYKVSDINGDGKLVTFSNNYVDKDDIVNNRWNIIPQNSILFAKIGEALKKNHRKINAYSCLIDNNIAALKPHEIVLDYNYFYYYFSCINAEWFVNPGTLPSINNTYLKNFIALLPSKNEQKIIANFLDQKTAEIDGLIADKEKLIELLQEKRQAIITEAVTKGLNPNVRMKDSGSEWIGEIPEHWSIIKMKYLLSSKKYSIKAGPFGSQLKNDDMVSGDIKVYNQKTVLDNDFKSGDYYIENCKYEELRAFEVFSGDLLVTTRGTIGKTAIVPKDAEKGILHPCLIKITLNPDKVLNDYVNVIFNNTKIVTNQIMLESNATTIDVIYTDTLKNLVLPIPPLEEQKSIIDFVDAKIGEIDGLISSINNQIQKLKEYRQSLISEAVTGKIDVRVFENKDEVIYSEQDSSPCRELTHVAE